jgi:hypothetical protein
MVDRAIYDVRQTQYPPVTLNPPADDRGVAPARRIGPGGPGNKAAPPPAVHQPKLLVPGQAKDAKAAEDQAKAKVDAYSDAWRNLTKLVPNQSKPAEFGEALRSVHFAQWKAESATWHNLNVQLEVKAQRFAIVEQTGDELLLLQRDAGDNPNPSTLAKLDAATHRLGQALKDYDESCASVQNAEDLLRRVPGAFTPATVIKNYPALAGAKDAFYRAVEQLSPFEDKNDSRVQQHLKQAAVDLRTAWEVARDDARTRKGSDPELQEVQEACDRGFEAAAANVENVTFFTTPQ